VWFQRGSESEAAIKLCESKGINPIYGYCILMFSEPVSFIHRMHRGILKLIKQYPKKIGGSDESR
jgi:hypothetical protein